MRPDVICDLHDLAPFSDASADEVLSVHVVEHFWRWEVRDILREWTRVLKPGGRMVIECPNLESACRTFLEDPVQFSREDQNGQRTMWVFYGDPAWEDPLMIHRWGYTPESLKRLLSDVGLAEVRQEPAQFKLREPRDMRVVGVKAA
jgi:SAM-dependent methyltransferase